MPTFDRLYPEYHIIPTFDRLHPFRGRAGQCPEACPEGRLGCRTVSCSCPIVVL